MSRPRLVISVAYDGLSLFESGIVAEVFGLSRPEFRTPLYRLRVAQAEPGELRSAGGLRLQADGGLRLLREADTVIVPGWRDHRAVPPAALLRALRRAHENGARVMSICTGAFVLAASGLLDGKRATTHWRYAEAFRAMFPRVLLDPDVLYVDEGDIVTSAGSAAGIDACLHVVRRDYGAQAANVMARTMVASPHRDGGQAQYIASPMPARSTRGLGPVLDWACAHLDEALTVPHLAARAAMSERTFLRRFTVEAGTTPKAWLLRARVRAAQHLLETSNATLEAVASASGFTGVETFRSSFRRLAGIAPSAYRRGFRARKTSGARG